MTTPAAVGIAAGTYTIDATRSRIRFRTAHAFGIGPVAGTFTIRDGTISVAAEPTRSAVRVRVDAASFTTDKPKRDQDIRSKRFLHAQAYPDLLFTSEQLTREGDRWLLHGRLTAKGTAAPVALELVEGTADATGCRFTARGRIDRYAHKVGPRGIVGRYLDAEFEVFGSASPAV